MVTMIVHTSNPTVETSIASVTSRVSSNPSVSFMIVQDLLPEADLVNPQQKGFEKVLCKTCAASPNLGFTP